MGEREGSMRGLRSRYERTLYSSLSLSLFLTLSQLYIQCFQQSSDDHRLEGGPLCVTLNKIIKTHETCKNTSINKENLRVTVIKIQIDNDITKNSTCETFDLIKRETLTFFAGFINIANISWQNYVLVTNMVQSCDLISRACFI